MQRAYLILGNPGQGSCVHALYQIQTALVGILDNLPNRPAAWLLRPLIFPLGAGHRPPSEVHL